ncbi:flavin reductase [Paraburkholderia silviterrae]|uniref:Flavin reductase n=1 Tax=Paraburkholderia silviterrae TaxID=2528715 RepID=A0A4R5MFC5_9BURK|nr:flavin reductase [Paraburkholderia silviterrae]TDG25971.1 flavin reductase [Paraburkholderia silviterrae]
MTIGKQEYRDAMARFAAAVNVITTGGKAGLAGFTASAVCSVTDDPPTLLVCANRRNDSYSIFKENMVLCVNTLTPSLEGHSALFAGGTAEVKKTRFNTVKWHALQNGAPVLDGAAIAFDCRIDRIIETDTHDVFLCVVDAIELGESDASLIYYKRQYHHLIGDVM